MCAALKNSSRRIESRNMCHCKNTWRRLRSRRTKRWTRSRGSGGFEMEPSLAAAPSTRAFAGNGRRSTVCNLVPLNSKHFHTVASRHSVWLALRLIVPLAITGAVIHVTRGNRYFDIFGPLVWSLFATHLVQTFAFTRTHLLDTGSFFCSSSLPGRRQISANVGHLYNLRSWVGFTVIFVVYLTLSIIGRYRADRFRPVGRSVSTQQVIAALIVLFVGVIACGTSKSGVGFLFVPGVLIIPVVLLWSLYSRDQQPEQPANNSVTGAANPAESEISAYRRRPVTLVVRHLKWRNEQDDNQFRAQRFATNSTGRVR